MTGKTPDPRQPGQTPKGPAAADHHPGDHHATGAVPTSAVPTDNISADPVPAAQLKARDIATTGHSWDGIQEYDNPLPRWWLWTFYACILYAILYSIAYPAWPMIDRATRGVLGYSTRDEVRADIAAVEAANAGIKERLVDTDLELVRGDPELLRFAGSAGASVFRTWCAQCHGAGAAGGPGYPNHLDDDWLWGGDLGAIYASTAHGIRNTTDPDARWSEMPAFGDILDRVQIGALVQHVRAISGQDHDAALAATGAGIYADNCVACHGDAGTGNRDLGAPDLTDAIWLYGGDEVALTETITRSRFGVMPAFNTRLSEADLRAVTVYVHGLGGGE